MKPIYDFEFDLLGIYNYNRPGKFSHFFNYLKDNHRSIPGNIIESGVFRGHSLLSIALFLKGGV